MAKSIILSPEDIPRYILETETEVDLSGQLSNPDKKLKSKYITIDGVKYWRAYHYKKGLFYTTSTKDPKILNTAVDPERPRGNMSFTNGDVARKSGGRPKGTKNKIDAKTACANLNGYPAEFFAAIMTRNPETLRKYGIKNGAKDITVAQQIKCAEKLIDKLEGSAKSTERDAEGNILSSNDANESKTFQVFLEAPKQQIEQVKAQGVDAYMEQSKQEEAVSFDIGD